MTSNTAADEQAIRLQLDKIISCLEAKDLDGLRLVYAPEVVSFDIEPPLQHVGIAAKLANWQRAFDAFAELTYEVRDLKITVGDDVGFGHGFGRLSGTLATGAPTPGMWVRATFCFRKINSSWLIVHDQASVPFDLVTGKGITDLEPSGAPALRT